MRGGGSSEIMIAHFADGSRLRPAGDVCRQLCCGPTAAREQGCSRAREGGSETGRGPKRLEPQKAAEKGRREREKSNPYLLLPGLLKPYVLSRGARTPTFKWARGLRKPPSEEGGDKVRQEATAAM